MLTLGEKPSTKLWMNERRGRQAAWFLSFPSFLLLLHCYLPLPYPIITSHSYPFLPPPLKPCFFSCKPHVFQSEDRQLLANRGVFRSATHPASVTQTNWTAHPWSNHLHLVGLRGQLPAPLPKRGSFSWTKCMDNSRISSKILMAWFEHNVC